ncbi:MAG: hypothetical protein LBC17_03995 [Lactobacillaceae bacterium]|jgi:hypothetical protein|nr:hypothetical protein [Lactobacillaceae bacterium]
MNNEKLNTLISKLEENENSNYNERQTIDYFVRPFFESLGYDFSNPNHVSGEVIDTKHSRPDYLLIPKNNTEKKIVIEAERKGQDIMANSGPEAQVTGYFNQQRDYGLAILTNGRYYKFFTDMQEAGYADEKPFKTIDLLDLKDSDKKLIELLKRDNFSKEKIREFATENTVQKKISQYISKQLIQPDDQFLKYIINQTIEDKVIKKEILKNKPFLINSIETGVKQVVSKLSDENSNFSNYSLNITNNYPVNEDKPITNNSLNQSKKTSRILVKSTGEVFEGKNPTNVYFGYLSSRIKKRSSELQEFISNNDIYPYFGYKKHANPNTSSKPVDGTNFWLNTNYKTDDKKKYLNKIADKLGETVEIDF